MEKINALLLDIDYETREGRAVLKLYCRSESGVFLAADESFLPYFYAVTTTEDLSELIQRINQIEAGEEKTKVRDVAVEEKMLLAHKIKVLRIVLNHPQEVPRVREAVRSLAGVEMILEHDILFVRRYLIDKGLAPFDFVSMRGEWSNGEFKIKEISRAEGKFSALKVLAFDTEVYNPKGAPREEKDAIIMVSLASNAGLRKVLMYRKPEREIEFVEVCESEAEILRRFEELVREGDYDVIMGYNTDNFDFPYIAARLKKLGMRIALGRKDSELKIEGRKALPEAKIVGRPHVDLYPIIRRSVKLSSYVLENVVRDLLGIAKEKIPGDLLHRYYDEGGENFYRLINYSMEDAIVALQLGEKFLPLYLELSRLVGQPLHDVARMTSGQLVEWLLMREAAKGGALIPERPGGEEMAQRYEETYAGGYVREPKKGISENIAVFDFRSLYPSVIVTHNVDPATFNTRGEGSKAPELEYYFTSERKGFIPSILERLIERRAEVKKRMKLETDVEKRKMLDVEQQALKILANSFYGYMGYPRARWYKKECAESVAAFARMYIKKVIAIAEEQFGFEVIYGDTDSLFAIVPKEEKQKIQEFLQHVNESLPGIIELDYEGFYKRGIFVTKKRYALLNEQNKIVVKGLEFVRRDWAPIAKRTQQEVLRALLEEASPEKAAKIVRKVIKDIRERRVSLEDITIYTQLTMKPGAYKNIEPHVVAAKKLSQRGREVAPGMIIGYVITRGAKLISQRAEPAEFVRLEDYDPNYYIENQILPAVLRIIEAIGYSKDYLKEGISQESIKKWFS